MNDTEIQLLTLLNSYGDIIELDWEFDANGIISDLKNLKWEIINGQSWNDKEDGKRIRNSEFLIFPRIQIDHVETISCFDTTALLRIATILSQQNMI